MESSRMFPYSTVFSKPNSILNSFVWWEGRGKLPWPTMQNTLNQGGMAVPDIQHYNFAAQLGQVLHWGNLEKQRVVALVLDNLPPNVTDPRYTIFGRCQASCIPHNSNFIWTQVQWIWSRVVSHFGNPRLHYYMPLWHNSLLLEFRDLPGMSMWHYSGLLYLGRIVDSTGLKIFQALKKEFSLPNNKLFRYLQLCHAFNTQFGLTSPDILDFPIPAQQMSDVP